MRIPVISKSLSRRLAATLWAMLFLFAAAQFTLLYWLWNREFKEHLQRVNWNLADSLAGELRPLLKSNPDSQTLMSALHRISAMNPGVTVYIVSKDGSVLLAQEREDRRRISVEPLEEFLSFKANRKLPLLGDHPGNSRKPSVFSAAHVTLGSEAAYLYVMLQGKRSLDFSGALWEFYMFKGGAITSIFLVVSSAILGTFVFFLVTRRFRILTAVVRKISDGRSETRLPIHGKDDIALLSTEINRMVDTIAANMRALEEKDRLRRDLVSNVSHDLGNPLSSAQGFIENILERESQDISETSKEALHGALLNIKLTSKLTRELLELSRLEAKETKPNIEAFSILDVVSEELMPKLNPLAEELGVSLNAEYPERLPLVEADIVMIQRVIYNLAENSIRYNRPEGSTTIKVFEAGSDVQVEISDTGPGIKEDDLHRIFDRFFRAKTSQKTRGTGLGLAIVKQLIEAHERHISVESKVGEGTTFRFSLPTT